MAEYLPPHPASAHKLAQDSGLIAEYDKYSKLADAATVEKTKAALEGKLHKVSVVNSKEEALKTVLELIPKDATVYNPASTSLWEIGFEDYVASGKAAFTSINKEVRSEPDQAKRADIRRTRGYVADYFITSVNAITVDGEVVLVDSSGSRVGPVPTSKNVIVVVGTHKLVPTIEDAWTRVNKFSEPIERARLKVLYGDYLPATWTYTYTLTNRGEFVSKGKFHFVFVNERIGH